MSSRSATTSWSASETEPQRVAILSAADRLLAGAPLRSTGNLSVVQLAAEADLKYWIVAQKHVDLRDHFKRLAAQTRRAGSASAPLDELVRLQNKNRELAAHCNQLKDLVTAYAIVINELSIENSALRQEQTERQATVNPLPAPRALSDVTTRLSRP